MEVTLLLWTNGDIAFDSLNQVEVGIMKVHIQFNSHSTPHLYER